MKIVNSKEQKLSISEIVAIGAYNLPPEEEAVYSPSMALKAFIIESRLPSVRIVQIGNSVFISHVGKGENSRKMVGKAINVDTARNYIRNMHKYTSYLQKIGITHYTTSFSGSKLIGSFKSLIKRLSKTDTEIAVAQIGNEEKYIVYIRFGKDSIEAN